MAVEIKAGEGHGYSVAALFLGKSSPLLASAKSIGVQIKHPSGDVYQVFYNGAHYGSIIIKPQAVTLAKEGSMGKMSKDAIKYQFIDALDKACSSVLGEPPPLCSSPKEEKLQDFNDMGIDVTHSGHSGEEKTTPLADILAKQEAEKPDWIEDDYATLACLKKKSPSVSGSKQEDSMTDNVCKLIDAQHLYQKVSATSIGSIYQVIMILVGAKIAARVKGTKLSLRAEGEGLSGYQEALMGFGFSGSNENKYLSLHINVPDEEIRKQVIGALAGRIGFSQVKEVGDICKVTGV